MVRAASTTKKSSAMAVTKEVSKAKIAAYTLPICYRQWIEKLKKSNRFKGVDFYCSSRSSALIDLTLKSGAVELDKRGLSIVGVDGTRSFLFRQALVAALIVIDIYVACFYDKARLKGVLIPFPFQAGKADFARAVLFWLKFLPTVKLPPEYELMLGEISAHFVSTLQNKENKDSDKIKICEINPDAYLPKTKAGLHNSESTMLSLLIVDEIHFGSESGSLVSRNVFSEAMSDPGCFIIVMSATAFAVEGSEIAANHFLTLSIPKEVLDFEGYYGIDRLQLTDTGGSPALRGGGKIRGKQAYKPVTITSVGVTFLDHFASIFTKKRFISYLRVGNGRQAAAIKKHCLKKFGKAFDVVIYDQHRQKDYPMKDWLVKVEKPCLVVILGFLRVGVNLPEKDKVWGGFDSGVNLDTEMQGLGGRFCGFTDNTEIHLYADAERVRRYLRYLNDGG